MAEKFDGNQVEDSLMQTLAQITDTPVSRPKRTFRSFMCCGLLWAVIRRSRMCLERPIDHFVLSFMLSKLEPMDRSYVSSVG
jgi:hypothetical protein